MNQGIFVNVTYFLMVLLCLLFLIILGYLIIKNKSTKERERWQPCITTLISQALFEEQPGHLLMNNIKELVKNSRFRSYLIDEIIQTKKNLAGNAGLLLKDLYESYGLDLDSAVKLKSLRWHIRAKGIQELSVMQQTKCVKKIFRLTNNKNELVRNEAQCGLVHFYGFRGLRFLNVMIHPISQWQQIQLLNKLNSSTPEDLSVIHRWLKSNNESVMTFALKLATHYNYADVFDEVVSLLNKPGHAASKHAINYLKSMPTLHTAEIILESYARQNRETKLIILDAIKEIGDESNLPFLKNQLKSGDEELHKETMATIWALSPSPNERPASMNAPTSLASVHILNSENAA